MNGDGKVAAFEFGIIAPRQNMKTGLFKMAALGWLFVTHQRLIVWSAHEFSTAQEAHRDMCELIKGCPDLDAEVKAYYYGHGDESIEMHNGNRLIFKARTRGGGRGLSGDKVVLDEAFALRAFHMGALLPTLSARPDPQVIYGSSAPLADSEILHALRKRGIAGQDKRLAFVEWSAPRGGCEAAQCDHSLESVGCAMDNRENWHAANSALGRRITVEYIAAERRALPPDEFGRERLGWADDPADNVPVFGEGKWEACAVPAGESAPARRRCFGLAVTLDRAYASIGVAGLRDDDLMHVEPIEHRRGTSWVATRAKALQLAHGYPFIIDGRGPASTLIADLEALDVELVIADTGDVLDGCAMLFDHVQEATVRHMSYPEVDGAVAGAAKRLVGDRWAWGRKTSTFDVSPLEAVTLAAWGSWSGHGSDYNLMNSFY